MENRSKSVCCLSQDVFTTHPPKFYTEPKNDTVQKESPFPRDPFLGSLLNFRGVHPQKKYQQLIARPAMEDGAPYLHQLRGLLVHPIFYRGVIRPFRWSSPYFRTSTGWSYIFNPGLIFIYISVRFFFRLLSFTFPFN